MLTSLTPVSRAVFHYRRPDVIRQGHAVPVRLACIFRAESSGIGMAIATIGGQVQALALA
jgi:hypothetical protein